jgi:transcriptional regulator with XRE-family HTH domain
MAQGMSNRIRELRESRGLSGIYIAEIISVSPQYLYDLEKGRRRLNETMIKQLALFFVVTTDYLLGLTDDPAPPRYLEESKDKALSIPPHLALLLDAAKDLPPEKIEPLVSIARYMGDDSSRKQSLRSQKKLSFKTTKSSKKSGNP